MRIFIADDNGQWREQVCRILALRPEWEIIGEASDGQQAVQQAAALQPDVVILDIGMPVLNGIETAKLIRQKSPESRIVFLSQNTDADVMDSALSVGRAVFV